MCQVSDSEGETMEVQSYLDSEFAGSQLDGAPVEPLKDIPTTAPEARAPHLDRVFSRDSDDSQP